MMDLYYNIMYLTLGMTWGIAIVVLLGIWTLWGICVVTGDEMKTASGSIIDISDMILASIILIICGGVGGMVAGILCPVTFPILCIIYIVYGIKIYQLVTHK